MRTIEAHAPVFSRSVGIISVIQILNLKGKATQNLGIVPRDPDYFISVATLLVR